MKVIIDTHLHLYPCYDLDQAFSTFLDRFATESSLLPRIACLAERYDCNFFDRLSAGEQLLNLFVLEQVDKQSIHLRRKDDNRRLILLPGRQVIAAEKVEVLALCASENFADGQSAAKLIKDIRASNGVPVLPWAPGKWFARRGKVINDLLEHFTPQDLLVGDTSLRPRGWLTPLLMRKAQRLGYQVIAGSDPLPFAGEERCFGMYASRLDLDGETSNPEKLLHALLSGEAQTAGTIGRRSGLLEFFNRQRRNAKVRKKT